MLGSRASQTMPVAQSGALVHSAPVGRPQPTAFKQISRMNVITGGRMQNMIVDLV
jgi:hypothetical protein